MNCLSPSILAADFSKLGEDIKTVDEAGARYIHFDVMDGCFVPNISFGIPVLESIRKTTERIMDVHLMIEHPENYIDGFAKAGADIITVHAEACKHLDAVIAKIKSHDILAGVAINPGTPISAIEQVLPLVDMVLIMTVNPGFGGQKLIPYTIDKVKALRKMMISKDLNFDIEVDGGITLDNVSKVIDAGANVIVAGSSVFKGDAAKNVEAFLDIME